MAQPWYRYDRNRDLLILFLHVQPNARQTAFAGVHGDSLKVRVAAPPVEGQANALLIDFLKKKFDLPSGRVMIGRGSLGRRKTVEITCPGPQLLARLEQPL